MNIYHNSMNKLYHNNYLKVLSKVISFINFIIFIIMVENTDIFTKI